MRDTDPTQGDGGMMRVLIATLSMLIAVPTLAQSSDNDVSNTILRLEAKRRESLLHADVRVKNELLSDDFLEVTVEGKVRTKSVNATETADGSVKWADVSATDEGVKVFGESALYTAVVTAHGSYRGKPFSSEGTRVSRYYVKHGDRWQCEYAQNTKISRPESAGDSTDNPNVRATTETASSDEKAIRRIIADNTAAFNRRDAKSLAAHVAPDGDHIGVSGAWISGRAAFEKDLERYFSSPRPTTEDEVEKVRFITSDVAIAIVRRSYQSVSTRKESMATYVFQRRSEGWEIAAFQNTFQ